MHETGGFASNSTFPPAAAETSTSTPSAGLAAPSLNTSRPAACDVERSQGWLMARRLEPMMRDVMDGYLYNVRYQPDRCSKLAKDVCEVIKDKSKVVLVDKDRYRIVVQVVVGQDNIDQTLQLATRCLCNQAVDSCATATYRNKYIYAMSVVCAFYTAD